MTSSELQAKVLKLIDDNCLGMCKEEYLEFLQDLRYNADVRAEAVRQEIEDEEFD